MSCIIAVINIAGVIIAVITVVIAAVVGILAHGTAVVVAVHG